MSRKPGNGRVVVLRGSRKDRASAATARQTPNMTILRRFLSGIAPLVLRLAFMPAIDGVGAQEGMTMLHRGAFDHHLSLVGTDGSQEQLAVTDDDVLYLGLTVDGSECVLLCSWFTKLECSPYWGRRLRCRIKVVPNFRLPPFSFCRCPGRARKIVLSLSLFEHDRSLEVQ